MKINVRVEVTVDGPPSDNPRHMAWDHVHTGGDNPRYFWSELQQAIGEANTRVLHVVRQMTFGTPAATDGPR